MNSMKTALCAALTLALGALPGCVFIVDRDDYPEIRSADAYCELDGWWELVAEVRHPEGSLNVTSVWVNVVEVWWDQWGEETVFTDLGSVELGYDGDGYWYGETPSSPSFLDCSWPWEYDLTFVAEDRDGDRDSLTITR